MYKPFPRQQAFHLSPAKYRLFGGAAGPGKTTALLWEAIRQALSVAGSDTLLLRRTYPELDAGLIAQFRRDVPRAMYLDYNEAKHLVTWPNGSTTRFGHCRSENDVYQYQGAEFLFIGVDELTHFTLKMWQFLTSRNRCPVPKSRPSMAGATNPGNIGHAWVKALWIDKKPPEGFEHSELYRSSDYEYVPSTLEDNPIYAHDEEYKRTLDELPGHLREAFRKGNWNIFAGQYFSNWEERRHKVSLAGIKLERWWPRWGSLDWGYAHYTSMHWHIQVGTVEDGGKARPLTVTYRELLKRKLSERALGEEIVAKNNGDILQNIYAGHDLWKEESSGSTKEQMISGVLVDAGLPSLKLAKTDRVDGWRLMHLMLDETEWLVSEDCPNAIAAIPQAVHDPDNLEDVLKTSDMLDDVRDDLRYGIYSQYGPAALPWEEKLKAQTSHLTDATNRAIRMQKLTSDREKALRHYGEANVRANARQRFSR